MPICYIKPVADQWLIQPTIAFIKKSFPTAWKVAIVCPIPKIDDPIDVTKYRPIGSLRFVESF